MKKTLLTLLVASYSFSAFSQCFKAQEIDLALESKLPLEICITKSSVDLVVPTIPALPYYAAKVTTDVGVFESQIMRFKEAGADFSTTIKTIVDGYTNGACESAQENSLNFNITLGNDLKVKNVNVIGMNSYDYDTCHGSSTIRLIHYK